MNVVEKPLSVYLSVTLGGEVRCERPINDSTAPHAIRFQSISYPCYNTLLFFCVCVQYAFAQLHDIIYLYLSFFHLKDTPIQLTHFFRQVAWGNIVYTHSADIYRYIYMQ